MGTVQSYPVDAIIGNLFLRDGGTYVIAFVITVQLERSKHQLTGQKMNVKIKKMFFKIFPIKMKVSIFSVVPLILIISTYQLGEIYLIIQFGLDLADIWHICRIIRISGTEYPIIENEYFISSVRIYTKFVLGQNLSYKYIQYSYSVHKWSEQSACAALRRCSGTKCQLFL